MPHVITLKDGIYSTIFDQYDMLELVEKYAGFDLRACISELMEENISVLKDCQADLKDAIGELDRTRDHNHSILCSIREEAEVLTDLLSDTRLNRKKMEAAAHSIWSIVKDEL